MWIILVSALSIASAVHYDHPYHRNQRIIKVQSSPFKHHPHHKHIRPGPLGPHVHYHDYDEEYHYEYVRPARPPPIPPFVTGPPSPGGPKYGHNRAPSSYTSFKNHGSPYKSGNNFRSPAIKDHFRGPSLPAFPHKPPSYPTYPSKPSSPPTFEYLPTPSPQINHIINSDDNRGPIHEIPAPNLGPKTELSKPVYAPAIKEIHETITTTITQSPYLNLESKPTYEVVESNDKIIEKPDGSKGYYAPDPDPSLRQPKVPPTKDPHSIPSKQDSIHIKQELGYFPTGQEYQLVEAGPEIHAPIPNLSSQELFDLMHSFPNDQYMYVQSGQDVNQLPQSLVSILAQPQYHTPQPTPNSHQGVQNDALFHQSMVNHQGYQDFNHPHYQTFNYEENNPNAAAVPMEDLQNPYRYDEHDASGSDSENSLSVVKSNSDQKRTESVKKTLPSDLTNLIPDDEYEREPGQEQDQSPIFKINAEVPFYSSLPNKETAEVFASLQAAGSVGSKINQLRGDQNPENESEDDAFFGLPKNEISRPQPVQQHPQGQILVSDGSEEDKKTEKVVVDVQKSVPLYEATVKSQSLLDGEPSEEELLANLDVGQGAVSARFGRKIRQKT